MNSKSDGPFSKNNTLKSRSSSIIPEWKEKISQIDLILVEEKALAMILIDASGLSRIESVYGKKIYNEMMDKLKRILLDLRGNQIRHDDILTCNSRKGTLFFVFLAQKRDNRQFFISNFEIISKRLHEHINSNLQQALDPLFRHRMKIQVGYAVGIRNSLIGTEHLIRRIIGDAWLISKNQEFHSYITLKERMQELILQEDLRVLFQPIVNLTSMRSLGYEALARGPLGTVFESPIVLFRTAEETDLMFELDRLCRKRALHYARELDKDKKLFINILPVTIRDPEFKEKGLEQFIQESGLDPNNIVFEVSEQQAIENFAIFKDESKLYAEMGFSIAIDDVGTGYSNFQSLVELKPQYIKLDISLIKDLHLNPVKQEIVRSMVGIGRAIHADLIAEGVEAVEEAQVLIDLGVVFAQGYLFAKPAYPFPDIFIPALRTAKQKRR